MADDIVTADDIIRDLVENARLSAINHRQAVEARDAEIERLRTENQRLCAAVDDLLPVWEPCRYDHHDYCQAHYLHERPCPIETLRKVRDMSDKEINEVISDLRAADKHDPELLLRAADAMDALGLFPKEDDDE